MEKKIIHNREVYINEEGNVIFDADGKVPYNNGTTFIITQAGVSRWNTYANRKKQEKSSGGLKLIEQKFCC